METRRLGDTNLYITPIGIGAWAIGGGGWEFGWGPQDDQESVDAIHAGLDRGMNWIDTAAVYGLGHSEEIVARALEGRSPRPYVFTKCGRLWDATGQIRGSLKAASIRRELESSLRRLRLEVIDLYQVHWPVPDEEIEEGWGEMARLQKEGKIRHIGVSNFSVAQMTRAQALAPIASLQPPYSLVARDVEKEILPFARENHIGVIVYSPMHSGLLTGSMTRERIAAFPADDWRRRNPNFQEPLLSRNLQWVEVLRAVGKRHGRSPGEVAIAWTLRHPAVTGAIVGVRSPSQVAGIIGAGQFRLSESEVGEIESGLQSTVAA
jgi:aryl-alcohol dehydrogenase-like predicted oxidoreductase